MAENRFRLVVGIPFKGLVDTTELELFSFGNARTFDQYLEFCGVRFKPNESDLHSCKQLNWVPYNNATDIETLLPGWEYNPTTIPPTTTLAPTTTPAPTTEVVAKTLEHTTNSAVFLEEKNNALKSDLRAANSLHTNLSAAPIGSSVAFMFFGLVGITLFVYTNDGAWRRVSRALRLRNSFSGR